jgi:hypothetical protein
MQVHALRRGLVCRIEKVANKRSFRIAATQDVRISVLDGVYRTTRGPGGVPEVRIRLPAKTNVPRARALPLIPCR